MAEQDRYPETPDVVIIGAGPAGAAAAALLAETGRSVLVLERRRFPRFHIGESMLPYSMALLRRLGLLERVQRQGYVDKRGAEFVFSDGSHRRVDFAEQGPDRDPSTFQLERAHFDSLLADHARARGATILHEAPVTEVVRDGERIEAVRYEAAGEVRTARPRYVIDAGGRASKISQGLGLRTTLDGMRRVAVYCHLGGLDERNNPAQTGDIQIGGHDEGWLWAIPIWPDTISVGTVAPRSVLRRWGSHEDLLEDHLGRVERISARARGTTRCSDVRVETDYSYYTDRVTGPNWFLVGDAGCFVDPIFSGGVFLAMLTGMDAATRVDRLLDAPQSHDDEARRYDSLYKTGYDTYSRLVYAYYESGYNLGSYLASMGADVGGKWFARLLSGDFWSDENPVASLLRSTPRWATFAPFEPTPRCPVYERSDVRQRVLAGG